MYYSISQIQSAAHKNTFAKWQERKRSSKSVPLSLNGASPTGSSAWIAIIRAVCRSLDSHNKPWICWSSSGSGEAQLKERQHHHRGLFVSSQMPSSNTFILKDEYRSISASPFEPNSVSEQTERNNWWKTDRIVSVWLFIDKQRIAALSYFLLSSEVQMN